MLASSRLAPLSLALILVVLLAGCAEVVQDTAPAADVQSSGDLDDLRDDLVDADSKSSEPIAPAIAPCARDPDARFDGVELKVVTHSSFSVSRDVLAQFENKTGAKVTVLKSGDAVETLNKAILQKGNPPGDLLFGVDNSLIHRALEESLFTPCRPALAASIPAHLVFDPTWHVTPVDYGYVTINYDIAALERAGLEPPASLKELTEPKWRGKLVVQSPLSSSPGFSFLLSTISHFGVAGEYTFEDYWRDLRANDVLVTNGWTEAYYTHFSAGSGNPDGRPLVLSYATSPAAGVYYDDALDAPTTGSLDLPGGAWLQIEGAGILKGTKHRDAAGAFLEFMLSPTFQEDIPTRMWMYPVNPEAAVPGVFEFAAEPTMPSLLDARLVAQNREAWLDSWLEIVEG